MVKMIRRIRIYDSMNSDLEQLTKYWGAPWRNLQSLHEYFNDEIKPTYVRRVQKTHRPIVLELEKAAELGLPMYGISDTEMTMVLVCPPGKPYMYHGKYGPVCYARRPKEDLVEFERVFLMPPK